jgi:putative spermidine/putrescine transport system ATP-binding protein/spermidine/putrescine transport system ATP-binding protein
MRAFITELQKSLNITTLFVTHDQIEAIELADHIGLMFAGEMVQYGTPESIFNRPLTPEIADFMGATNLIHGTVSKANGSGCEVSINNNSIWVETNDKYEIGSNITLTIRPEHMEFFSSNDESAPVGNILPGRITEVVYHGGTVSYYTKSDDIQLQTRQRSTKTFSEGSDISIHLPSRHLWIFPR